MAFGTRVDVGGNGESRARSSIGGCAQGLEQLQREDVVSQKLRKHKSEAAGRLVGLLKEQSGGSTSSKAQARLSGVKR